MSWKEILSLSKSMITLVSIEDNGYLYLHISFLLCRLLATLPFQCPVIEDAFGMHCMMNLKWSEAHRSNGNSPGSLRLVSK